VWEPTELIAGAFKGEVKPPGTYGYSNTNWIVLTELRPALEVTLWTRRGSYWAGAEPMLSASATDPQESHARLSQPFAKKCGP
jgi:hypothetical protein